MMPSAQLTSDGSAPRTALGRPRKFAETSRPVTVTLPQTALDRLAMVHPDRGLAIAKAADIAAGVACQAHAVELAEIEKGTGIIMETLIIKTRP